MAEHSGEIPAVMLGVGAAFDFHAGSKPQAPKWMQRAGLEWFFRLAQEPGRLWRRYLYHNPRFLFWAEPGFVGGPSPKVGFMLRRFSTNFALLSMLIDMLTVIASMVLAADLRPSINGVLDIKNIPEGVGLPLLLYVLFPWATVFIFSSFALYDGKKFLRAVDEFSTLTLAFVILSISMAGILTCHSAICRVPSLS